MHIYQQKIECEVEAKSGQLYGMTGLRVEKKPVQKVGLTSPIIILGNTAEVTMLNTIIF